MAVKEDIDLVDALWRRYHWVRDNGHLDYVSKAERCEDFFAGMQWDPADLAALRQQRRPALTINKIISTLSNVMGEQIFNRSELSFRPRNEGASQEIADTLTKVAMQVSDNNQLDWLRSDVFADGVITSRGFFDVRIDFSDNVRGEVRIRQLNPKNVFIDPDADDYDPRGWQDVILSKWLSTNEIAIMYDEDLAKEIRNTDVTYSPYSADLVDIRRDRFGNIRTASYAAGGIYEDEGITRHIRVVDRQYRVLKKVNFFVDLAKGDMREVPDEWDREQIAAYLSNNPELTIINKVATKIRWTVVAGRYVLHDDWSPYVDFTVVPYFPYFRRGRTVGLVENLLGPQELLNKVSSQELHIVNTTANSGWKIKRNSLTNMDISELELRGAETGLVMELDDVNSAEKIAPNPIPSGLDRVSYKAEEHIKTISGVSDYQTGFAREDVSARAVERNQASGQANLAKPLDNLRRTDFILGRTILDLVQRYYTEERIMHIVTDRITGATEAMTVNQVTPEGEIVNDLTLGEYDVVITTQPERDTFEDTQFSHALGMFEKGIPIPPDVIVASSKLKNKADVVKQMRGDSESPEAQAAAQRQIRLEEAEIATKEADAQNKSADAASKMAEVNKAQGGIDPEMVKIERDFALKSAAQEKEFELKRRLVQMDLIIAREKAEVERQIQEEKAMLEAWIKSQQANADLAKTNAETAKIAQASPEAVAGGGQQPSQGATQ